MPGERMEAVCRQFLDSRHEAPHEKCTCGIYAFRLAKDLLTGTFQPQKDEFFGEVWLWGRIIEHTKGFKAQYAYPKELFYIDLELAQMAPLVALYYGVPVTHLESSMKLMPGVTEVIKASEERAAALRATALKVAKAKATKARNAALVEAAKRAGMWQEIEEEVKRRTK